MPIASALVLAAIFAAERPPAVLPLRKLRLYETGVGYFERHGAVGASKRLGLPLPASHLDDALKSLVVLESSGAVRVQGVQFSSAVSHETARVLAGLPSDPSDPVDYGDLLHSLEGARVQVRLRGGSIAGRLVQVEGPFVPPEDKDAAKPPAPREPYFTLLVLDEADAVRRVSTRDVLAVKAVDKDTASRLNVAAESGSGQRARQQQRLEIQVTSRGQLGIGYIAEAPVWRTTYRVVLGSEHAQGQLQAWALVHNDTDEDWRRVQMEFVNGQPRSFLHSLAVPRYAHREVLDVAGDLSTVPQTDTWGGLYGTEIGEAFGVGGLGLVGTGRGGGGRGEGTVGLGTIGHIGTRELGDLAELSKASTLESGAQFIYRAAETIDLDAHHSALVPLVQEDVEVESITLFGPGQTEASSGVRLVNTTGGTLPAGVASFFADGGFVGEAVLDRLKAKERRFIAHGEEMDVDLIRTRSKLDEETLDVELVGTQLRETFFKRVKISLDVHNRSARQQKVYASLDVPRRADLSAATAVELDFDLARGYPMVAVEVSARSKVTHPITVKTAEVRAFDHHDPGVLEGLSKRKGLAAAKRSTLGRALVLVRKARDAEREVAKVIKNLRRAEADLARQRKNLAAVGRADASSRLKSKLTKALLALEAQIKQDRTRREELAETAKQARRQATAELKQL